MIVMLLTLLTLVSTSAGGLCALRLGERAHLLLGFTAGALLGVVSFDLLPEIFALSHADGGDGSAAMVALVAGFVLFHAGEATLRGHFPTGCAHTGQRQPQLGTVSAIAMVAHSLLDGASIGLAFQVSPAVGTTTAIAVIAHDFCDGLNTVNLMLAHGHTRRRAQCMLALNAIAPLLGAASTLLLSVPAKTLVLLLGFFAGVLLYIGASDILPRTRSQTGAAGAASSVAAMVCGVGGMPALMWLVL